MEMRQTIHYLCVCQGNSTNGPPTPPTRRESINVKGGAGAGAGAEKFESRFSAKFRSMQYLPPPEMFSRCQKTYPSKNTPGTRILFSPNVNLYIPSVYVF